MPLEISHYQDTLRRFNYTPHWDLPRWGNALAGEVGEACNLIKKIDRGDFPLAAQRSALGAELADVIAYATHLANAADIDLERALRWKFAMVARERGSPITLDDIPSNVDRPSEESMMKRPKIPAIAVDLYDDQTAEIEPMMRQVREAAEAGKPGFLCAQVFVGSMRVFFIDHNRFLKFQELMGQEVGKTGPSSEESQ
jgi:NTP pyrophosphatase (non-canonical NTP hydrolase)